MKITKLQSQIYKTNLRTYFQVMFSVIYFSYDIAIYSSEKIHNSNAQILDCLNHNSLDFFL